MDPSVFARGLLIGLSIAAPVGPIGVLCIRRTLIDGRLAGLATGLGAATADACYGAVAGFGVTAITSVLLGGQGWIRLIGGLCLCYLGLKTALTPPAEHAAIAAGRTTLQAYGSALALTLTNPLTILSFAAIFAGLGVGAARGASGAAAVLVLGVFVGSTLWWVVLSSGVAMLRRRIGPRMLRWINRLSGGILVGFGLLAFASLLMSDQHQVRVPSTQRPPPQYSGEQQPREAAVSPSAVAALALRHARLTPGALAPADILTLQRTIGNAAVNRVLQRKQSPGDTRAA